MHLHEFRHLSDGERAVSEVLRYISAGGDVNGADTRSGWTLLHAAAEHQNLPLIAALVRHGADLNARNNGGWTALHFAVDIDIDAVVQAGGGLERVAFETARLLLSLGANADARDSTGRTARDVAEAYGVDMALRYDRLTSACG